MDRFDWAVLVAIVGLIASGWLYTCSQPEGDELLEGAGVTDAIKPPIIVSVEVTDEPDP